jgi:hypothetical protein
MGLRRELAFPILLLSLASSLSIGAQDNAQVEARNAISADLLMPFLHLAFPVSPLTISISSSIATPIAITYRRVLNEHFSLSIVPLFSYSGFVGLLELNPWLEFDWHPFDLGLGGFYIGPACSVDFGLNAFNHFYFGLGAGLGYQFLLPLNLDLNAGLALTCGPDLFANSTFLRTAMRLEIALGYRF